MGPASATQSMTVVCFLFKLGFHDMFSRMLIAELFGWCYVLFHVIYMFLDGLFDVF